MLPYTLCFIRDRRDGDDLLLMLHRDNPPNQHLYNGVGGKLQEGETPRECVLREIAEETQLNVTNLRFGGVVTWEGAPETGKSGMYVYTADWEEKITRKTAPLFVDRDVDEGMLRWMPTEWCCAPKRLLVSNIPHFLPPMLNGEPPCEFFCQYDADGMLDRVTRLPLADDVVALAR